MPRQMMKSSDLIAHNAEEQIKPSVQSSVGNGHLLVGNGAVVPQFPAVHEPFKRSEA